MDPIIGIAILVGVLVIVGVFIATRKKRDAPRGGGSAGTPPRKNAE